MKSTFPIPGPLGNYLIFTKLNKGGMADVYLAQPQYVADRWVAIKTLLPKLAKKRKFVSMFKSEGVLGMMFDHPNIVRTWDIGEAEIEESLVHYLAMDYVHGRDLGAVARSFRKENTRMPIGQALYIAEEVLKGLSYAHDLCDESGQPLHLVNRDVSPANIMISFDGEVRLIDFGIAQATMDFRSQIGSIRGKLSFMSPEQVRGLPVDARSDQFSLGVVLYQLLTGVEPFVGEGEFEQMEKIRAADPTPPSSFNHHVSAPLEALVMRALAKRPADRFFDAADMLAAVQSERARLGSDYGQVDQKKYMQMAFKGDIHLLQARVDKARMLLESAKKPIEIPEATPEPEPAPARPDTGSLEIDIDVTEGTPITGGGTGGDDTGPFKPPGEITNPEFIPEPHTGEVKPGANKPVRLTSTPHRPMPVVKAPKPPPQPTRKMPGWVRWLLGGLVLAIVVLGIVLAVKLSG